MTGLGIPFHLTEVDGVPCFWADAPGPCGAGLLFRVGRADETLAGGGVTELAIRGAGGQVHAATTAFYAEAAPNQIAGFLERVCSGLHAPGELSGSGGGDPGEEPSLVARLLMMRFGAAGHGLPFYEQYGLRRLSADDVAAWARRFLTRGNAALWMTCPPPHGLRLGLPEGPRVPPPEPHTVPGLELPAYAAAGSGTVATSVVARRSTAIAVAGRVVAERVRARTGLDVSPWQLPLSAELAHRSLAVDCPGERAAEVVEAVVGAYDSVAAEGPAPDEVSSACRSTIEALADPEAVAGGLDRMAVDELLGAPRRWKEDLAREAQAVSYAEAAAALREALSTLLVLAPAGVAAPAGRDLHPYPWFSRERVQGMELKPVAGAAGGVRLVVSQEGVSHVADDSGRASTVRFADVAAALQEPDGTLTLIGRDGAVVPLDPNAFRGAGEVAGDLERKLPPDLVVPPRDAGTFEEVARRKLRRGLAEHERRLLRERLDPDEAIVTLCQAIVGYKLGLLAVTDRRVIWLHHGPRDPMVRELPYGDVLGVKLSRFPSRIVTLRSPAGETAFASIEPKERAAEIVEEVERRARASVGG